MEKNFLIENEKSSNRFVVRIFWGLAFIQFPIGFFLAKIGALMVNPIFFLINFPIMVPIILIFHYLLKKDLLNTKLKYFSMIFLLFNICMATVTYGNDIAIQLAWLFPTIASCLYFNAPLTASTAIGSIILASIISRISPILDKPNEPTDLLATLILLSFFVLIMLFIIVRRTSLIFNSLMDAEERNRLMERLNKVLTQSQAVAYELNSSADQFAVASEQVGQSVGQIAESTNIVSQNVEEVMGQTNETSSIILDIVNTSEEVATHSNNVGNKINQSIPRISNAVTIISNSLSNMTTINDKMGAIAETTTELYDRSQEIKEINEVMNKISKQIRLLALNTAIEAARAGVHGRSFMVISEAIRDFSKNVEEWNAKVSEQVSCMEEVISKFVADVHEIQGITSNEYDASMAAQKELGDILRINEENNESIMILGEMVKEQLQKIRQIPKAIQVISAAINEITQSAESNAAASEETAAAMEELIASAENLKVMAETLKNMIEV
ncbi:MAG TPA: methyl-accepting chemotaxis protein [Firmicutes bacterium]|nr:methyl-accepting chemotaxis protein [Bacillota bacterium]